MSYIVLSLRGCFLLVSDRTLARSFTRARIGVCALSTNRQVTAMPEPSIGSNFDEPLNLHRGVLTQITLDATFGLNNLTDTVHFLFVQVLYFLGPFHTSLLQDLARAGMADTVNVSERNRRMLITRKINPCNTCHSSCCS